MHYTDLKLHINFFIISRTCKYTLNLQSEAVPLFSGSGLKIFVTTLIQRIARYSRHCMVYHLKSLVLQKLNFCSKMLKRMNFSRGERVPDGVYGKKTLTV